MKFRKLGLLTGLTLGGGLFVAGLFSASLADSNSPGAGIMLVIGAFLAIPGLFIIVSTLFGWGIATLFAKTGKRGRTLLLWTLALFFLLPPALGGMMLLFSTPGDIGKPLVYRYEKFPSESGSRGGAVVTMEAWANDPDNPHFSDRVVEAGAKVTLLAYASIPDRGDFTEYPVTNGFPWFQVHYGEGQEGIMWGGDLCANMVWVNGLNRTCAQTISTDAVMDSIENAYTMLPAVWVGGSGTESTLLHITPQAGKEAHYAQVATTYANKNIYPGTWQVSRPHGKQDPTLDGHIPLILTIGPMNSHAGLEGKIVRLNDNWLVVELPNGERPGFQRARDPEAAIAKWRERSAIQTN